MKLIRLFTTVTLIVLCGCQTVKEARDIQKNETPVVGEYTPAAKDFGITPDKTISLDELQQIALQCHPSIRTALYKAETAYLAIKNVKADYLPSINGSFGYSRNTDNFDRHDSDFDNGGTWNGALSLDIMIYDFGKTDMQAKQLAEVYKAALLDLKNAKNTVVYNVRTAFYALNRAIELDAVAKQTIKQYEEHRDQVKTRKEVGVGTSYDLTKAEVDVYNAILAEHKTRNDIDIAWAALIKALGFSEKVTFKTELKSLREYTTDINKLMELAKVGNPTLSALETAEKAASYHVDKTIADLYPTFSLSLSGNVSGRSTGFPLLWNLSGAASVVQNFFSGGRSMNAIKEAALALKSARASRTEYEQTLFQLLQNAALNAQLAQQQLKTARQVEKQAKDYFDIVSTQYQVGKSSALERTDAQVALSQATASVVTARFDYQDALANIAMLIGDFPEPPRDTTPKPEP